MENFEYMLKADELLGKVYETDKEAIRVLAKKFAEAIEQKRIIHVFGTGHSHMIGVELFCRAGGLANVNAMLDPDAVTGFGARRSGALEKLHGLADIIYDQYQIMPCDIMIIISNSGRNAVPIEMAMRARREGVYTVALTNYHQSKHVHSRHSSGKRLFECVDLVLDNCAPDGDGLMRVNGIPTGPASTLSSVYILNTVMTEALKIAAAKGISLPVFGSQNVDGVDNESLYEIYGARVKHC